MVLSKTKNYYKKEWEGKMKKNNEIEWSMKILLNEVVIKRSKSFFKTSILIIKLKRVKIMKKFKDILKDFD